MYLPDPDHLCLSFLASGSYWSAITLDYIYPLCGMSKYAASLSCGLQIILQFVSGYQLVRISVVFSFRVLKVCFKHSQISVEGHLSFSQINI